MAPVRSRVQPGCLVAGANKQASCCSTFSPARQCCVPGSTALYHQSANRALLHLARRGLLQPPACWDVSVQQLPGITEADSHPELCTVKPVVCLVSQCKLQAINSRSAL